MSMRQLSFITRWSELCLFSLHVANIMIPLRNVLVKQGEDFYTLNIPVSSNIFVPIPNTLGQCSPHGPRSMHSAHFSVPRKNSHITVLADAEMHITGCFRADTAQAAGASLCTKSLGKGSCWCCALGKSLNKLLLKLPDLSYHFRAHETGTGHSLKSACCRVWKCLLG